MALFTIFTVIFSHLQNIQQTVGGSDLCNYIDLSPGMIKILSTFI